MPTINLPDDLYQSLKREAEIAGTSLEALATQRLRHPQAKASSIQDIDETQASILDLLPYMIYVEDIQQQHHVYANLYTEAFFGISLNDMQGVGLQYVRDQLHPDDMARLSELVTQWDTVSDTQIIVKEFRLKNQHGDYRWMRNYERIVDRNDAGNVIRVIGTAIDVHDEKLAEALARQSDTIYRTVMANLPKSATIVLDQDFRYVIADGDELEVTGFASKSIVGQVMQDVVQPETYNATKPYLDKVFQGESNEMILPYQDSKIYRVVFSPLYDADEVQYALILITDITNEKTSEIEARNAKQQLELALEMANIGMWQYDVATEHTTWNDQQHTLYGTTPIELENNQKLWRDMLHADDCDEAIAKFDQVPIDKKAIELDYRIIRKDGEIRHINSTGTPLINDNGHVTHIIGFNVDVTHIVEAQRAVLEMGKRYEMLFHNLQNHITVLDKDARVVTMNKMAANNIGYESHQVEGMLIKDLVPTADDVVLADVKYVLETQSSREAETLLEINGEKRWWWSSAQPIFEDDGTAHTVQIISYDITDQKRAQRLEEERAELQRELEKEQALVQQRQRMMSVLSHEVKTPLAIILNGVEFLTKYREQLTPERRNQRFEIIRNQVWELDSLLDDIANQIKYEQDFMTFQPTDTSVYQLLSSYIEQLKHLTKNNQALSVNLSIDDNLTIMLDQKLFYHAVSNIVSNAIKYSPQGGLIQITGSVEDDDLVMMVKDTGIGIAPKDIERVFSAFERGNNVGQIRGTGMGLAIVREIAELHSGIVNIESDLGIGTTVCLRLPLVIKDTHPSLTS
ncbi:MAG: PAS domain S-box protein [Chloroflexota bacterium]